MSVRSLERTVKKQLLNKTIGITSTISILFFATTSFAANNQIPAPLSDQDYHENGAPAAEKVTLGRFLFFDKILSGNQNISCATCHHTLADWGDGLSLPIGEGGRGLGVTRDTGSGSDAVFERVPRNAPHIFNIGAKEFTAMFHDGRVTEDATQPSGFASPAGADLPVGLDNVVAAQAMFPVTSATEMAGQAGENSIADAADEDNLAGPGGVWEQLADRLRAIPGYVDLFQAAYGIDANDITYVHAANAIAAYESAAGRADQSPFDNFLRGNIKAMSLDAYRGMRLFYGYAQCASCHSGALQTDHQFHAIGMPQIGPGKGNGFDGHDDFGREAVTGDVADRYKFRTLSLRNVALTGPWGHDGAFDTLEAVVRHHLNPEQSITHYDCENEPTMPSRPDLDAIDCLVQNDPTRVSDILDASEINNIPLSERQIGWLITFLHALTDPASIDERDQTPDYVPSGLSLVE